MTKYQLITGLYETEIQKATNTPGAWTAFMRSACRNYKCSFDEQILIYAQRPDATAVLEIEKWNKQFGRWVNQGATGIAVIDKEHTGKYRLKHYFDVSDTHGSRYERPIPIWQMRQEYEAEVIESLENSFGELENKDTLANAIMSAASNAVEDNISDYLQDLLQSLDGSHLERLDDNIVEIGYRAALRNSVSYMMMTRCGIDADKYLNADDFSYILGYNTRNTVNALGIATSDIAEMGLREIAKTVINLQRQEFYQSRTFANQDRISDNNIKNVERGFEYDRNINLQDGGRLPSAESDRAGGQHNSPWQVRITTQKVSETEPPRPIHESVDGGDAQRTLEGNRADGTGAYENVDSADGGDGRRERTDESIRSDEMGRADEQHSESGGGIDTARPDIRIKPLPTHNEQLTILGEAEETVKTKPSAFSISQQIIDEVLTSGGNEENSVLRIVSFFKKDYQYSRNANFLQKEYGEGGKGFVMGGNKVSVWFDNAGLYVAVGETAQTADATLITWEQAATRIRELLDMGRYAPQSELDKADGNEITELAQKLYFLYRDDFGRLPEEWTVNGGNYDDSHPVIAEHLCNPAMLDLVIKKLDGDNQIAQSGALEDDFRNLRRFRNITPDILDGVQGLEREPVAFTADETISTPRPSFITQDEVDTVLIGGSGISDGKFRIYAYFLQDHSAKDKADFLKDEYGWGGTSRTGFSEAHDPKGLSYSRENNHLPYDKVTLPWSKVAKRIDELIADGRYMSGRELDYIPEYEKEILAGEIYSFYDGQREIIIKPYLDGMTRSEGIKILRPQLDEPARVTDLLDGMESVLDNTADFDSKYQTMKKAFDDLTAFHNGTFSLFATDKVVAQEQNEPITAAPADLPTNNNAEYDLHLGTTVYLGIEEYEINAFDDTRVILFDPKMPLFHKEMLRDEFDRKLRENRLNDGLIKAEPTQTTADTPRVLYRKLLPKLIEDIKQSEIYPLLRDREVVDGEAEEAIRDWLDWAATTDEYPGLYEAFEIDQFKEWMIEDILDRTYQDFTTGDDGIEQNESSAEAPEWVKKPAREEQIREVLSLRGYAVSDELIADGIEGYDSQGITGHIDDIADYIVVEYLTEEPTQEQEPEAYIPKPGDRYEIQGRQFIVDTVDLDSEEVRLRDITFESKTGFPIFRADKLEFIQMYDPIKPETTKDDPALADNQHIETIDGVDFVVTTPFSQPRQQEDDKLKPAWEQTKPRSRTQTFDSHPEIPMSERHNYRLPDDFATIGGAKAKFKSNIAALNTLADVEFENRFATPEEQEILAGYVGWGGLSQAFDPDNKEWENEYLELNMMLSPEDFASARASTLTAFYTSPVIIKAMYQALENMGFKTGNILDPGCGIGNFQGLLPESMSESKIFGVEVDSVTGRIARQLYQKNNIAIQGYEKTDIPDSFFDLAIGNIPFADIKLADKRYDKHNFQIHDYFFARTLDKVRPGGVIAFVTSKGTLDKHNSSVRKYIAQRADLLGAIRLPNNAFHANAGTEVTSDIIFLQKRDRIIDVEPEWVHLAKNSRYQVRVVSLIGGSSYVGNKEYEVIDTQTGERCDIPEEQSEGKGTYGRHTGTVWDESVANNYAQELNGADNSQITINQYFADHPEMVLGTMALDKRMNDKYGRDDMTTCLPIPDADLAEQLAEAITNIHAEINDYERDEDELEEDNSIPADPRVRNFSYTVVEGDIYYRQDSRMVPVELSMTAQNRVKGLIELRECVRDLIMYQTDDYPEHIIQSEQAKLNRLYDSYTKKYGLINSRGNSMAFSQDSAYCLICSLEVIDENGELERKADMFQKRTINPHIPITHVDTPSEALAVSLADKARVDLPLMSELTGVSEEAIIKELEGVIFRNPLYGYAGNKEDEFLTADEYLSGNVREKLDWARKSAEIHPEDYSVNVTALEAALPPDLTAGDIAVRLGATWLPPDVIEKFMFELLQTSGYARSRMNVRYFARTGEWNITEKNADRSNVHSFNTYGTDRISAYKIMEDSLNLRDVRIFDKVYDENGNEKRVLNKRDTAIAQSKQELIKSKFDEWIWKDSDRRERLCQIYNERFNSIRPREYDGSHIKFVGMNPEIQLRKHQIDAIAHVLYGGNTLLAHEVGAGKTYEMVAAAMEGKRLGLCNKSLIVVPNHITEQWSGEFLQLYPSANILVATKKDFETKNRKKFCARIATGDFDAIIIGHSQFEKIPMSVARQEQMLQMQIDDLVDAVDEVKRNKGERYTIKQLEKLKKSLETRLTKLTDQSRKDDVVTFEELGVDRLFIDEAHYYKNLFLVTKMRNVGGIAQVEAQKSSDLFMKCRYLDERTDGRGTVFATGTPISNSMVELYTMQRYLQYKSLVEQSLQHFDSWASTFGETVTAIELAPEGTGYRAKTRFAKFYNLPELMSMFRTVADIQTADMLNLPVPQANFHTEVIKPSQWQQDMILELAERAKEIRDGNVDPTVDNMLLVTNDGRKLALDQRIINPMLPDDPDGKVSTCANNVFRIWEESKDKHSTQLVFSDLSTPKGDGKFNVYDEMKKKLIEKGIPEHEIAFIHDADTETRKKELFAKVRKGQVRVLMGSTQKMGSGTNVQNRLIALHDLDCPWRPSDLAQRLGRIVRQGNKNPVVEIFRYVTEGTFDSYLYQLVENKQKFIAQIMTSKLPVRSAEDVDDTALSYAEIKALATGNPLIIEKCQLEMDVNKLKILHASHLNQKYALEDKIHKEYPQEIKRLGERIEGYKADIATATKNTPADKDTFPPMKIGGIVYSDKAEAGKAIVAACKAMTSPDPIPLGEYKGFAMTLFFHMQEYGITLKGSLSHDVRLGTDTHGNITRLDNKLEGFTDSLSNNESNLENVKLQLETAKSEVDRPFVQEQEYSDKSERLKELNILLNMDQKDKELLDVEPDETDIAQSARSASRER